MIVMDKDMAVKKLVLKTLNGSHASSKGDIRLNRSPKIRSPITNNRKPDLFTFMIIEVPPF